MGCNWPPPVVLFTLCVNRPTGLVDGGPWSVDLRTGGVSQRAAGAGCPFRRAQRSPGAHAAELSTAERHLRRTRPSAPRPTAHATTACQTNRAAAVAGDRPWPTVS